MPKNDVISTSEATEITGLGRSRINQMIKTEELIAFPLGGKSIREWEISVESIMLWLLIRITFHQKVVEQYQKEFNKLQRDYPHVRIRYEEIAG